MSNLPISQLPEALSGSPDSLMVIVNYDIVPSGVTYSIPFSALTSQFNPTPVFPTVYGLFAQTGDSQVVSGTTVESTLLGGGVGTLSVPANGFSVGDSFKMDIAGILNCTNNQTLTVRVKTGSVVLLDSGPQQVTNITNDVFRLYIDFTIRNIGGTGTASIVSLGSFLYSKTSNGTTQGFAFNVVNDTTFDTTVPNTLDVMVQWGSTNSGNSIYSDISILNKIY